MGIPWKRIFTSGKVIASILVPQIGMAIEGIEAAVRAGGADKKERVEKISDASIEAAGLLELLKPEQMALLKATRGRFIDAYVSYKNADAELRALIESFKPNEPTPAEIGGVQ